MTAAPTLDRAADRPLVGIGAVLFGAFISTLNGRLSVFGLADIRGALGMSFDEAAWITTAQTVAQMLIGPLAAWAGAVLGPRRVLMAGCTVFATASVLIPFSRGGHALLVLQFVAGLGSGCFVPLTVAFVLRHLPPRYWALGVAAYALNLEASLNIAASIEGFYTDHASWQWLFWQNVPLAVAMAVCVQFGIPRQPVNRDMARQADWFGMASASIGLALIYAALDQGNRLDWLGSGLIVGLLAGGGVLMAAFLIREIRTPHPGLNLRLLLGGYVPVVMIIVAEVRFASLSTAYLVPQFLVEVRGFRSPEVGDVLLWLAAPQIIAAPFAALILRLLDVRLAVALGLMLLGGACWITASTLTPQWASGDFLATQLMQGIGQTLAVGAAVFVGALHMRSEDAPTFGAMVQVARLFGGELGYSFIVTFVRKSEQITSNLLGGHAEAGNGDVLARLQATASALASRAAATGEAAARALEIFALSLKTQANVQSYIDGFYVIAASTVVALFAVAALPDPPNGAASPIFPLGRFRW